MYFISSTTLKDDSLTIATKQLANHIRYTQLLALYQDMFTPSSHFAIYKNSAIQKQKDSKQWFKKWWQITFHTRGKIQDSYSIFSDHPTKSNNFEYDTAPELSGMIAKDPLSNQYIIGDVHNNHGVPKDKIFTLCNLEKSFGVKISKVKGCGRSKHLLFDSFGRAHCSKSQGDKRINPYYDKNKKQYTLLKKPFCIELTKNTQKNVIFVTPITGYVYIKFDSSKNDCR